MEEMKAFVKVRPEIGGAEYMDFDCSWSEDGTKIVFNRLPAPWLTKPSQV